MIKRLFFGIEVHAPWPQDYPRGRLLDEAHRHMTLAFLGNVDYQKVTSLLTALPKLQMRVGLTGFFDQLLFLPPPPRQPSVVAWHVYWKDSASRLLQFQAALTNFLGECGFHLDDRPFLPHVTLCRSPFDVKEWKASFIQLPCYFQNIHLYESKGNLCYEPIWTFPLEAPFEEIEHTADIAYTIRGESLQQLHRHAEMALAFRFPGLLPFLTSDLKFSSLQDSIMALNEMICKADGEIGCPFKAVSFHGEITQDATGCLRWEMIVDV